MEQLNATDTAILINAAREAAKKLKIEPFCYPDAHALPIIRLYDNLATLFGGDEVNMRGWLETGNRHLGYTPRLRVYSTVYLEEINNYLEHFRYH